VSDLPDESGIAHNVWHGEAALNAKATGQPIVLKYILNNMP